MCGHKKSPEANPVPVRGDANHLSFLRTRIILRKVYYLKCSNVALFTDVGHFSKLGSRSNLPDREQISTALLCYGWSRFFVFREQNASSVEMYSTLSSASSKDGEEIYFDFRKQQFIYSNGKETFCKLPYPSRELFGYYLKNTGHGSKAKVIAASEKWGQIVCVISVYN
ncbi:hypothetical protein DM860_001351 [Cuscuta australis]|uniref:Uncharacterized protein n=1 Tax=Cuscuta australis TaxID=267555 RepID=A0A328DXW1_9ASTE|nr:hypothetical protein DM860_001351 [Cuscuta australis]